MEAKEEEGVKPKNKGGRPPKSKRKPRRSVPPKRSPIMTRINRARAKARHKANPKLRKQLREKSRKGVAARKAKNSTRIGIPDGWTRDRVTMQRVYDGIKADLLIDKMKAEGMVDETKPGDFEVVKVLMDGQLVEVRIPKTEAGMAEAALREVVIGALSPLTRADSKLGYARTVLEWTKPKPAATSNVNVNSEDWLAAALQDNASTYDDSNDEGATGAP